MEDQGEKKQCSLKNLKVNICVFEKRALKNLKVRKLFSFLIFEFDDNSVTNIYLYIPRLHLFDVFFLSELFDRKNGTLGYIPF